MFTKYSVLALCAAASLNGAAAAVHHRHEHPRRELVYAHTDLIIVTEVQTVTVYANEEPTTAPTAAPTSAEVEGDQAFSEPQEPATTVAAPTYEAAPPPPSTTLATFVKPPPAVDSSAKETTAIPTNIQVVSPPAEEPATSIVEEAVPTFVASPAPTTAETSAPAPSGGSKRGAAYNDVEMLKALLEKTDAISWVYNWGDEPWGLDVNIPYYPMMWGEKFSAHWMENAQAACDKGTEVLFSFNEPDNAGQANMSPEYAAAKHQEWMNPFADKARIAAPAITSSWEKNQGLDWLDQFFKACDGKCQFDFCNAHWYGPGGDEGANLFLEHIRNVHKACDNKPVWVTEFMAEGSASDNEVFMKKVVESLDGPEFDFVEKYSYFMVAVGDTFLMSSTTEPNTLGKIYANLA
ncbi:hypothetical protein DL767_001905 [Monosporascus sp. MG133]|nr:hypothetical protein DL767_001905 [Monosporascus sp. MG133]